MTLPELYNILKAVGYPVAYSHFKEAQTPPFICYLDNGTSNFMADDKVYKKIEYARIELYTVKKDLVAEAKLEQALNDNEIVWDSMPTVFIDSEQLFQKIYELEMV